jgi:ketosteroid isomerase-like protein
LLSDTSLEYSVNARHHPRYLVLSGLRLAMLPVLLASAAAAQPAQEEQRQIENDVWIPLMRASVAFDAEGFLAVQSKDLVRVSVDAGEVYGLDRYQREIREGFPRARARGITRQNEVRFLQRVASDSLAWETGYFRSQVRMPDGEERVRYTRFEMVLRKEGGKWKILVDKDTSDQGKITEAMFEAAAKPIQPVN